MYLDEMGFLKNTDKPYCIQLRRSFNGISANSLSRINISMPYGYLPLRTLTKQVFVKYGINPTPYSFQAYLSDFQALSCKTKSNAPKRYTECTDAPHCMHKSAIPTLSFIKFLDYFCFTQLYGLNIHTQAEYTAVYGLHVNFHRYAVKQKFLSERGYF